MKRRSAVVAIGGNSLIKDRFHQTVRDQYIAAGETCWHIASMIQDGWDVAIGHGNGPQVGFILRRSSSPPASCTSPARRLRSRQPGRDRLCADAEPGERLPPARDRPPRRDRDHAGRGRPRRPGVREPFQADRLVHGRGDGDQRRDQDGWAVREDAGRGWRRVVASPDPIRIVEEDSIKTLIEDGFVVVPSAAAGSRSSPARTASSPESPP